MNTTFKAPPVGTMRPFDVAERRRWRLLEHELGEQWDAKKDLLRKELAEQWEGEQWDAEESDSHVWKCERIVVSDTETSNGSNGP